MVRLTNDVSAEFSNHGCDFRGRFSAQQIKNEILKLLSWKFLLVVNALDRIDSAADTITKTIPWILIFQVSNGFDFFVKVNECRFSFAAIPAKSGNHAYFNNRALYDECYLLPVCASFCGGEIEDQR